MFNVDTREQCNVLPRHVFEKVVASKKCEPGPRVTANHRQPVNVVGQERLDVAYNNISFNLCRG
jgi:hypothetical protein